MEKVFACIDLKSFYASCECVMRNLNPITTNLVVADKDRTNKTICLAVSPSLKSYGISGRARLYEVISKVDEINKKRKNIIKKDFINSSYNNLNIKLNPHLKLDFIIAKPRMSLYMKISSKIYNIYLKYVSKEDIFVYSIDEVFMDITNYLKYSSLSKEEFITRIVLDIYKETGITATAGIGTNLYLAKVAMDILAKHQNPNNDNVQIATLDEITYRKLLWNHTPLTDFWRIGKGYNEKLIKNNLYTMGDIARYSMHHEDELFKIFGINAEILIDHAWGYEPCNISDIKKYKPKNNSISSSQVLKRPYNYSEAKIIVLEMVDSLVLQLIKKNLVTDKIGLVINYDIENIDNNYNGIKKKDYYGRIVPKESSGVISISYKTLNLKIITKKTMELYEKIINPYLSVRRVTISFIDVINYELRNKRIEQFSLFTDYENENKKREHDEIKEKDIGNTIINIKEKYGKNSIIKGINLLKSSTMRKRNEEIGGHHE